MSHAVNSSDAARPAVTFTDLGLPQRLVTVLTERSLTTPFPIQAQTIPDALAGRDVLGRGRTGSGKTLSFGLPMISRLAGRNAEPKQPRGVILAPTRELAVQVNEALEPYGRSLGLTSKTICGGMPMPGQIQALKRGVDILVATPGRLRDLIRRGSCSLAAVEVVVLDEADQMADLGFLPEVRELLDYIPRSSQHLLFSATLDRGIDTLVKEYLDNPVTHAVDPDQNTVTTMSHHLAIIEPSQKTMLSAVLAARGNRTIAFVRTQLGADRVAEQLTEAGLRASAIHGGLNQSERTKTLAEFKEGKVDVLVATDVAARGIHIDDVDLVLHIDPAGDSKDYLHRAGRTARAGRTGIVVTMILPHQQRSTERLMEKAGVKAKRHLVRGRFTPDLVELVGARSITDTRAAAARLQVAAAQREVAELHQSLDQAQKAVSRASAEADQLSATAETELRKGLPLAKEREPRHDTTAKTGFKGRPARSKGKEFRGSSSHGDSDKRPAKRSEYAGHKAAPKGTKSGPRSGHSTSYRHGERTHV